MMLRNFAIAALSLMVVSSASAGVLDGSGGGDDRYIGANDNGYFPPDTIGVLDDFDISSSSATTSANSIVVSISGGYFDNPGELGCQLGDLFLDFNNYTPDGSGDAGLTDNWFGLNDNMFTGTRFGYAVRLTGDLRKIGGIGQDVELWRIDNSTYASYANAVIQSDTYFGPGGNHRNGQEVQVNTLNLLNREIDIDESSNWINDGSTLTITVNGDIATAFVDSLGIPTNAGTFAYHWAMLCGNDTVEAGISYSGSNTQVPEPSTAAIFGLGVLGLAFAGRRRKNKNA